MPMRTEAEVRRALALPASKQRHARGETSDRNDNNVWAHGGSVALDIRRGQPVRRDDPKLQPSRPGGTSMRNDANHDGRSGAGGGYLRLLQSAIHFALRRTIS